MSEKLHKIYSPDGHIPEEMLLRYVGKQLSPAEEHRVERHALHCEMCSDTLEGLMYAQHPDKLPGIISNIQKEIQQRSATKVKVVRMNTRTILSMAAGVALVCSLGYFLIQQGGDQLSAPNTSEQLKDKEESSAPKADDSSDAKTTLSGPKEEKPQQLQDMRKSLETVQEEEIKNESGTLSGVTKEGEVFAPPVPMEDNVSANGADAEFDDLSKGKNLKDVPNKSSDNKKLEDSDKKPVLVDTKTEKDVPADGDIISLEEKQKNNGYTKSDKKNPNKVVNGKVQKKNKSRSSSFDEPKKVVTTHPDPSPNMVITDENKVNQDVPNTIEPNNTNTINSTTSSPQSTGVYTYQSNLDTVSISNGTHFELGVKYFEKNSMDTAIIHLEKIKNVPPYAKYEEARWKLAQAYLKKNEKVKAKAILLELSKGTGVYKKPATDKLKELQ